MRTLYKALASIGMIALSTAAALGVKHLATVSRNRKKQQKDSADKSNVESVESNVNDSQATTEDSENTSVVTSETEIKPDHFDSNEDSEVAQNAPEETEEKLADAPENAEKIVADAAQKAEEKVAVDEENSTSNSDTDNSLNKPETRTSDDTSCINTANESTAE